MTHFHTAATLSSQGETTEAEEFDRRSWQLSSARGPEDHAEEEESEEVVVVEEEEEEDEEEEVVEEPTE